MRVVIIGGSGHVGTYLVPRLVAAGHGALGRSKERRRAAPGRAPTPGARTGERTGPRSRQWTAAADTSAPSLIRGAEHS